MKEEKKLEVLISRTYSIVCILYSIVNSLNMHFNYCIIFIKNV